MPTETPDTQPAATASLPPDGEECRPDLQAAPQSPPADQRDVERGREKLERVLAK